MYLQLPEVGSRYFSVVRFCWSAIQKQCFRFALVRNFKKYGSPLALFRYSATAIFSVERYHQSAIPLFCYHYFHCIPLLLVRDSAIPLLLFLLQSTACCSSLFHSSLFRSSLFQSSLFQSSLFLSSLFRSLLFRNQLFRSSLFRCSLFCCSLFRSSLFLSISM